MFVPRVWWYDGVGRPRSCTFKVGQTSPQISASHSTEQVGCSISQKATTHVTQGLSDFSGMVGMADPATLS